MRSQEIHVHRFRVREISRNGRYQVSVGRTQKAASEREQKQAQDTVPQRFYGETGRDQPEVQQEGDGSPRSIFLLDQSMSENPAGEVSHVPQTRRHHFLQVFR